MVSPQELKDKLQKQKYKQWRQQRRQKKLLQKHRKLLRKKNGENSSPQQQQQQHPQQQQPIVTNEFPEAATAQLKDDLILDASGGHTLSVASHQCELCNTEFSCLDKLYQHTRSCHQLIQKKCLFCTEEFEVGSMSGITNEGAKFFIDCQNPHIKMEFTSFVILSSPIHV